MTHWQSLRQEGLRRHIEEVGVLPAPRGYPITPADLWAASGAEPMELSAQGLPHAPSAPEGIHHLQAGDPAPMAYLRSWLSMC